ncbi:LAME_0B07756g1_1 [Lachancea meyersii CBS 8951]|uniref:LAME_0B07756g1_1 n=1 Tax=Lachancea meyersii CBS 8951 TaxID=1266667 RepID=A0A1G4IWU7_9SACH|nr:LAME_0B07756g1_1 [Lachancea meyersii CBS 8951]
MSRAKEIEEKLGLQASLQAVFNNNKLKAFEWLQTDVGGECSKDLTSSKASFYQLPVVAVGAGLSFDQDSPAAGGSGEEIATVGEFIQSDKKVSSLAKKKKRKAGSDQLAKSTGGIHKINADDTRAMIALKRKMKNSHRGEIREKLEHEEINKPRKATEHEHGAQSSDSDANDEPRVEKTKKKSFGLLFQGKQKKRK